MQLAHADSFASGRSATRRELPFVAIGESVSPGLDRELVAETLWKSLPFSSWVQKSRSDHTELLAAYERSHRKLISAGPEVDRLFSAIARATLEVRGDSGGSSQKRRGEYRKRFAEIRHGLSFDFAPAALIPENSLLANPIELVERRVESRLRADVQQLVDSLAEKLDDLVSESALGEFAWNDQGGCTFHYFGHVLIEKTPTISVRAERKIFREGFMEITTDDKLTVGLHRTDHRAVRHEHRLENAQLVGLSDCSIATPVEIVEVINAVPPWLRPVAGIVVGECVHERIIKRDVGESVQEEIIGRESVRSERYIDPAVVIGPYVLAGWGGREIKKAEGHKSRLSTVAEKEAELQRLDAGADSSRNIGFLGIICGLIVFGLSISSSTILPAIGVGAAVGGVLLFSHSIYLRSIARIPEAGFRDAIVFGAQISLAVGALFTIVATIALGSALPLALAVLFAFAFLATGRFASE